MKKYFLFISILWSIGCTNTNWDKTLLYGDWQVSEWINTSTNKKVNAKMDFSFVENGEYSVDYGGEKEEGTFWIMGDFLHTIEKGQAEKKVKLTGLTSDIMSFEMNRGGTIEVVKFKKK